MLRKSALVGISIGLASACGSFETDPNREESPSPAPSSSPDSGRPSSGPDGGQTVVDPEPDSGKSEPVEGGSPRDAGTDADTNLLVGRNGNFEEASGCDGWTASLDDQPGAPVTLNRVTMRHSGSYACKVCITTASTSFTVYSPEVSVPEGTYEASVWVHRDGASMTPADADPYLQQNQSGALNGHTGFSFPNAWWERTSQTTLPGNLAPAGLRMAIRFDNSVSATSMAASTCIFVDDAVISKMP